MALFKNILLAIFLFALLLAAAVFLFKERIIRSIVNERLSEAIGAPVRIESLSWDFMGSSIEARGFRINNPQGFPDEALLYLNDVYIEYDLSALLKKELHLPWLEIDSKEVVLCKGREGKLNVQELKPAKAGEPKQNGSGKEKSRSWPLHIEVLKLKLGRVVFKDFSSSGKPKVEVYELRVDKTYKNITNPKQVFDLMLLESLKPTALKGVTLYGLASAAGSQILPPVGVAVVLTGKDSAKADFPVAFKEAFKASLEGADDLGDIIRSDENKGLIKANIRNTEAIVRVVSRGEASVTIAVSARKFLFPKPHTAEGLLYQISDKLK